MKRLLSLVTVVTVVAGACSGDSGDSASFAPSTVSTNPAATSVVAPAPSASTIAVSTTLSIPPPSPDPEPTLVVAGPRGVYEVDAAGSTRLLLDGEVAFAIDDTMGGLLFQIDRGRSAWDQSGERNTAVWWLEAGASSPRTLLVPTPGVDHELSLHDAYFDDGLHVVYTRHDGTMSADHVPQDFIDRLRSHDVERRLVTDLVVHGAWEAALDHVSCAGGVIAFTSHDQVSSECVFVDRDGNDVVIPADTEDPNCEGDCRRGCALSSDSSRLVYLQDHIDEESNFHGVVVLLDARTGDELDRLVLQVSNWRPEHVGLVGEWLLASFGDGVPAVIYDSTHMESGPTELPVAGTARFARAPFDIPSTVRVAAG